MDMYEYVVQRMEQRIKQSRASLGVWRNLHSTHQDAASHRNYSRALAIPMALVDTAVQTLCMSNFDDEEYRALKEEWDRVDLFITEQNKKEGNDESQG